jgi:hypothetical protein
MIQISFEACSLFVWRLTSVFMSQVTSTAEPEDHEPVLNGFVSSPANPTDTERTNQ